MTLFWLVRMRRWVENPPSWRRVLLVAGVVLFCLVLYGIETFWGWPDWLTAEPIRRGVGRP